MQKEGAPPSLFYLLSDSFVKFAKGEKVKKNEQQNNNQKEEQIENAERSYVRE